MVKSLIVNSSNYVGNATFIYNLKSAMRVPNDIYAVAISNISFYNNSFNITSSYGNNTLTLIWLGTSYTITIPNGYYSCSDINAYIQAYMYSNGLYMTTNSSNIVYFAEFVTNSPRYAIQLNMYPIPTSSQANTLGYSLPSGVSWSLPSTAQTPQLTFNSAFGSLVGLSSGTYPSSVQTSTSSYVSSFTPIISPVNSYTFTISLINNIYSNPNNIICEVPLNASFGSLVTYTPPNVLFHEIYQGTYSNFSIQVFDQNMNILNINDDEFVIHLAFVSLSDLQKLNGGSK